MKCARRSRKKELQVKNKTYAPSYGGGGYALLGSAGGSAEILDNLFTTNPGSW